MKSSHNPVFLLAEILFSESTQDLVQVARDQGTTDVSVNVWNQLLINNKPILKTKAKQGGFAQALVVSLLRGIAAVVPPDSMPSRPPTSKKNNSCRQLLG
jgi:hypothetical protein